MDGDRDRKLAAEVARATAAEPGRLKRYSATAVLAFLSAAAVAPVVASGGSAAAVTGVLGNVGAGLLSAVIDRAIGRVRDRRKEPADPGVLRDELAAELRALMERGDAAAADLRRELTDWLIRIGGIEAAVQAAGDDLRDHLLTCFGELAARQDEALRNQRIIAGQQRYQTTLIEEMLDRQRMLIRLLAERGLPPQPDRPVRGSAPLAIAPVAVPSTGPAPIGHSWRGGAEVVVGDCAYLLYSDCVAERFSTDHSVVLRQARGLRLVPAGSSGQEYAWLRQAEVRTRGPAAQAETEALTAEGELLARLRSIRGLPRVIQQVTGGHAVALILTWPASRSAGGPCETLQDRFGPGAAPMDSWRMHRLLAGLAGLCGGLARLHDAGISHRHLAPPAIIVLDDGRLVLRDLGLAARSPRPGEGPTGYQAPEQRGHSRPGPATDVYQIAAIAYHLLAGCPPHPRVPLPLRSQASGVPEQACAAVDAALALNAGDRPGIRSLGQALRTARETAAEE